MSSAVVIITDALTSGALFDAMDDGYDATCDALSDLLDATLRGISPPYDAAMTAIENMPKLPGIDLEAEQRRAKRRAFQWLMELTELDELIKALIAAWQAIPTELRHGIRAVVSSGGRIWDAIKHPSIERLAEAMNMYAYAQDAAELVVAYWRTAGDVITSAPRWLTDVSDDTVDAVADALTAAGAGPVGVVLKQSYGAGQRVSGINPDALSSAWKAVKAGDIKDFGSALLKTTSYTSDTADALSDIAHGDLAGAASRVGKAAKSAVCLGFC